MKDLLHDTKSSRKIWIIFIIIIILGGGISLFTYNEKKPLTGMADGSRELLVKNLSDYDVQVSGKLYGGFANRSQMAFIVPARSTLLYTSNLPNLLIGRKGSVITLRLSRVDDRSFRKTISFNGFEGLVPIEDLLMIERLWVDSRWVLIIAKPKNEN